MPCARLSPKKLLFLSYLSAVAITLRVMYSYNGTHTKRQTDYTDNFKVKHIDDIRGKRKAPIIASPVYTGKENNIFNVVKENLTIVTAYFNLGSFQKGTRDTFTSQMYFKWAKAFAYIVNPVVVYTDSEEFEILMSKYRKKFKLKTRIFLIKKTSIWAFRLFDDIKTIFSQPGYPKHHPNTVLPDYSCAQHAKYALVAETIRRKLYDTEFYAWLDVGYFRDMLSDTRYFLLNPPPDINRSRLLVNVVKKGSTKMKPVEIMRKNIYWVGGGMFIGTADIILKFEKLYKKAVNYFISQKLMNTDQQVIYSLYSDEGRKALNPDVELQAVVPIGKGKPWFYLGYLCRYVIKGGANNETL